MGSDQEVFFMGMIDALTPIFPSHLTCHGVQHLKLLIAAKDSFSEKRRRENTWEERLRTWEERLRAENK